MRSGTAGLVTSSQIISGRPGIISQGRGTQSVVPEDKKPRDADAVVPVFDLLLAHSFQGSRKSLLSPGPGAVRRDPEVEAVRRWWSVAKDDKPIAARDGD